MRKLIAAFMGLGLLFVGLIQIQGAVSFSEDFSGGIKPDRWGIFHNDAAGAPWTITAPDQNGWLQFSKVADYDPLNMYVECGAGIQSKFQLIGDFSVAVDFNLVDFPVSNREGWNEAILRVLLPDSPATFFEVLRFSSIYGEQNQWVEVFLYYPTGDFKKIGLTPDPIFQGSFGITRSGGTLSAWIDRGSGPVLLGSETSAQYESPMSVQVLTTQVPPTLTDARPSTSLDVRFDNISITAEAIVPEPSTFILLGIGALGMLYYAWRRRA